MMRSWRLTQSGASLLDRVYDRLRQGVNRRLVQFLAPSGHGADGVSLGSGARVLEAGSGTAYASSVFATRPDVCRAVCLDRDIDALREARRRDPSLPAVVGDIMRMPFADGSFSLVFNSSTVEHLDKPPAAVREMARVCAPGGRVFVGVPYRFGPLWFQPLISSTAAGIWLGPVFTRFTLDRLLHAAGLMPVAHVRYFLRCFIGAIAMTPTRRTVPRGNATTNTSGGPTPPATCGSAVIAERAAACAADTARAAHAVAAGAHAITSLGGHPC